MRTDEIIRNNQELTKNFDVRKEEGAGLAMLSVLTDISETLAMIVDIQSAVYGRVFTRKGTGDAGKQ